MLLNKITSFLNRKLGGRSAYKNNRVLINIFSAGNYIKLAAIKFQNSRFVDP